MLPDKKDQKSLPRAFGNLNRRSRDRKINNFDPLRLPDTEHHEPVQLMRTTGRCEPPQPEGLWTANPAAGAGLQLVSAGIGNLSSRQRQA